MTPEIDGAFNLTTTYRTDSDIKRHYGDIESSIRLSRFDETTGELLMDDKTFFKHLINTKFTFGK